jgi:Spy/CpxP family protein refolding chaperone
MSIANIRRSILILAGAGALAVAGLFAGRLAAGVMPGGGPGGHFGASRFGHIARMLDLTDAQRAQFKSILRSHGSEIEAQLTAGLAARRALHDAILADPIDEAAIRARAGELSRVEADGAVLFAKVRAELSPLLTDDQKQKVARFREHMRARGDRTVQAFQDFVKEEGS